MEFDEMKRIWDAQNGQALYVINESALHHRILSRKRSAEHITNWSELALIVVNLLAGAAVFITTVLKPVGNAYMYAMSGWMLITAVYFLVYRVSRLRGERQFDRSMLGDLDHAILVSTRLVRISRVARWNIVPIALFSVLGVVSAEKSVWIVAAILTFFVITHFASQWEHGIYVKRKHELEKLRKKLSEESGA